MAGLFTPPFFDVGSGITPADGAKLHFNIVGSDTDKDTYTTAAADVEHTNPVIADSVGVFAQIFLIGDYDWILTDKNDVQINTGSVSEFATATDATIVKNRATLALSVADTNLVDGDALNIAERTTGNGGGAMWDVVLSTTVTENTIDIVQCTGVATLSLVLRAKSTMTGREFGLVSDFVLSTGAGADNFACLERMMIRGESDGINFSIKKGSYKSTAQVTQRHNIKVDWNGSDYALDHSGVQNDSPFQMGNNTRLRNIDNLYYRSTSADAFNTIGLIKIGEFSTDTAGENSLDSTYWQVSNVTIEDVAGSSSFMTLNTDRNFTATVYIVGGDNVTTNNISLDGLADDGIPVAKQSSVRTESAFSIPARKQGFNLNIKNTVGTNLRAHPENAVVYINGDRNTRVINAHGQDCGQIFACNSSGNAANQDPSLRGKNGVNIKATNITGFDCKIFTGDTFSKLTAGVNVKFEEPDLVTGNRSRCIVENIVLESTQTTGDKLGKGIAINDNLSNAINTKRIAINGFECGYFPEGLFEDAGAEQSEISNGWVHHSDSNGATLRGIQSTYNRIKITLSNQSGLTDANGFNGHGLGLQTLGSTFNECIFGDDTVASGSETQLSSIHVSANDTRATLNNCRIGNFKTGNTDIGLKSGVTGAEISIDEDTKGQQRNVSTAFPIAPGVAKCVGSLVGASGAAYGTLYRCTSARTGAGVYTVTFDKEFLDANYIIELCTTGGAVLNRNALYRDRTVTGFTIHTFDQGDTPTDADVHWTVHGNYNSQV